MNDEKRDLGPGEPSAELELTDYQHRAEQVAFENKMLRAVLDSMPHNMSVTKMPLRDDKGELIGLVSATRESRCASI